MMINTSIIGCSNYIYPSGYGYQVRIVSDVANIDNDLAASFDWALKEIRNIQSAARRGEPILKPRWPVIILRTPKGLSGPKSVHGEILEGSFRSHQVPLPLAKTSAEELDMLVHWLKSYKPNELFNGDGTPVDDIIKLIPERNDKKLGQRHEAYKAYTPLGVPDWRSIAVERGTQESCMKRVGEYIRDVIVKCALFWSFVKVINFFSRNSKSFRIFSPDELVSNKLDAVFQVTGRDFQWDPDSRANGGRIVEILSEHTCQGMLQGYTLTGRTGLFPSYEAFLGIVATMMVQYSKFMKVGLETPWRGPCGSINYIETSTWARQEHNGFSHQNPSFIGSVLNLKPKLARVYLPPDANCFLSTIAHCLRSKNYINLMVGSKHPSPVWLSPEEADMVSLYALTAMYRECIN